MKIHPLSRTEATWKHPRHLLWTAVVPTRNAPSVTPLLRLGEIPRDQTPLRVAHQVAVLRVSQKKLVFLVVTKTRHSAKAFLSLSPATLPSPSWTVRSQQNTPPSEIVLLNQYLESTLNLQDGHSKIPSRPCCFKRLLTNWPLFSTYATATDTSLQLSLAEQSCALHS